MTKSGVGTTTTTTSNNNNNNHTSMNGQTTTSTTTTTTTTKSNQYLDEIKNLSQKYFTTPLCSDNLKITNKYQIKNLDLVNKLNELNLLSNLQNGVVAKIDLPPDTPPPSPTNELADDYNDDDDEIENIIINNNNNNNNDENFKYIATPPTSPINVFDNNNNTSSSSSNNKIKLIESNFVNEIIERLSIFSFKSIEPTCSSTKKKESLNILKPLALYANNNDTNITPVTTPTATPSISNSVSDNNVPEKVDIPDTPPSSPMLRMSPTPSVPINDEMLLAMDEKKFQNSAFFKVSTMNPIINKTIDLSKLLGSLTSLKRNQRFC